MSQDLFEALSKSPAPPPPPDFDAAVHRRLNDALWFGQVLELICQVAPYALVHFAQAAFGLIAFTFMGRYPAAPDAGADSKKA